jgi:AcrR family transcriptional regulator
VVQELGRRARRRLERHGEFLRAAKRIAFAEGLEGLTMQRLGEELDCAIGTVYTYFPSKSALVAEVQREAIEVLEESCGRFEVALAGRTEAATPAVSRLALVIGYARFWVDTFDTFPEEARLLQVLMSDTTGSRQTIDDVDVSRVLPAALRLLERLSTALAAAADAGAVDPGDAMERTVVLVASLNGVLQLDTVARVDPELFDGRRLARGLVVDLLRGWGADDPSLAGATERIEAMAGLGPLATRPPTTGDTAAADPATAPTDPAAAPPDRTADPTTDPATADPATAPPDRTADPATGDTATADPTTADTATADPTTTPPEETTT